jgi:hypothetical protein
MINFWHDSYPSILKYSDASSFSETVRFKMYEGVSKIFRTEG